MKRRLYRSRDNQMVAGVLAGLAEYFEHDPTIWRILFVILLILTGLMPGVLIYIVMWIMTPIRPLVEPLSTADYSVESDL